MPLTGSGAIMGALILSAIGNTDPAAIPAFSALGDTIAAWVVANVECEPTLMMSAGAAVSGFGSLSVKGSKDDLGKKLAKAMNDPSDDGVKAWTKLAKAIIAQLNSAGQVNPAAFVAPTPSGGPLTGTGLVQFSSTVFSPLLGSQLDVSDTAAAAMLEVFGETILAHIATNAIVVPLTTFAPLVPFTGPPGGGPITGAGAIT